MSDRIAVSLKNGPKLFYASSSANNDGDCCSKLLAAKITDKSDLEAGIYEGGLKLWECAVDLCNFLCGYRVNGLDVLELGCGAALPSILALSKGASSVCVQDFNEFVIETFTKRNFALNGVELRKCTFVSGEWGRGIIEELGGRKFDLILTSETIYNESNYEALHDTIDALLSHNGKVLLSAKSYYFGVGGSIPSFVEFIRSKNTFARIEEVWSTTTSSIPRKILLISRN